MASSKGKYQSAYESQFGSLKSSGGTQLSKNQNSINNLSARLSAGGVDPNEAIDKRNWLEQALNLKQDQNFIFDIFELLNRPQQALFGGIESLQQGGDFLEGAGQGISGNKDTQFKDILMNTGYFDDEKGKLNLVDVLGFAGDVFLDPMDLPLIPVSAASKGAKALDTAGDIAKAADTASDVAKAVDTAGDIAKVTEFISPTQALGRGAKGLLKKGANIADTGIEKALTKLDASKGILYKTPENKWASELGRIGEDVGKLEIYKGLKNNFTTMFDTKLSKAARQSKKVNEAKEFMTDVFLNDKLSNISTKLDDYAVKLNIPAEELDKMLNKAIDVVDTTTLNRVIDSAKDGTIKYTDELKDLLINAAKDAPDEADILINSIKKGQDDVLELGEEWTKYKDKLAPEKLNETISRASFLSPKEQQEVLEATQFLQQNAPDLLDDIKNFTNEANDYISKNFESMEGLGKKFRETNLEGFSKHRMAENYEENVKKLNTMFGADINEIDKQLPQGSANVGIGSRTLNTRKYNMPAEEANILKKRELKNLPSIKGNAEAEKFIDENINLFETGATAGIQSYIDQMPKLAKNTQIFDEVMFKQGFGDLQEMSALKREIASGVDAKGKAIDKAAKTKELNKLLDNSPFRLVENGKTPYGFKRIDKDMKEKIVNLMYSTGQKTGSESLIEDAGKLKNLFDYHTGDIAIDPTVLNIIKFNTDKTTQNEFGKMYNGLMNFFKKNSTASLTNQMNNLTGNMTNMAMSGMSMPDIAKYSTQAVKDLNGWEDVLRKGVTDVSQLTDDEVRIYNRLKGFMENVTTPDKASILKKYDMGDIVKDLSKKDNKNIYDRYVDFFATLNAGEDRVFRYALYSKAMDDTKFMRNLGIEIADNASDIEKARAAGQAVSKVLFDPSDLTAFEQNTMKNVIPFYTFTKKNLAYQISNMGDNLQNYNKLMKSYNSILKSFDGNEENIASYLKENMYIPIPSIGEDGKYKFIRAQLPFGDLTDLASDPLKSIVNRGNPFVKALYENVGNVNTLTGREIESFPGQKGNIGVLDNIPVLNRAKFQQGIGNLTGINTQLRMLDRGYQGYQESGIPGIFTNNATISGNIDSDKLSKTYEQINDLQNLMKQYEQKGYKFSTISELKKANKNNTVAGLDALFAKYGVGQNKTYNTGNKYYDYYMNNRK